MSVDLSIKFAGIKFENPFTLAASPCTDNAEMVARAFDAGWAAAVLGALLGTAAFGGIGLLLAGTLPGVATLALANGLYLVLLLTGGMVVPLSELPAGLAGVAKLFPAAPLAEIITGSLGGTGVAGWAWISLTVWAIAAPLAATALFRWDS